jgi:hypothetical protein
VIASGIFREQKVRPSGRIFRSNWLQVVDLAGILC